MARISDRGTKPEIAVRKALLSEGLRFGKNVKRLQGTPDIVLKKYRTIVFVNGCFWHGHKKCRRARLPKTNKLFWITKIQRNIERDRSVRKELRRLGWKTIVVWQCRLTAKNIDRTIVRLLSSIKKK